MMNENVLMVTELERISQLSDALKGCGSTRERIETLDQEPNIKEWMGRPGQLRTFLAGASEECELIIKSLIAIGQEKLLTDESIQGEQLRAMLDDLIPTETFYKEIGGIVGYHKTMQSLLVANDKASQRPLEEYHRPPGIDISSENESVSDYIFEGIVSLPKLAEMYPVGGAADRLKLYNPITGQPLPAAMLVLCGKNLLEWLIRDIQGREYLYYKMFKEQVTVPVAMMTSHEKDDHNIVVGICKEKGWFGRSPEAFRFFCQPLVPTMDRDGQWCLCGPLKLLMKPGGHGVIWKIAKDEGVLDWLESLGRKKLLVRQINNPIAGTDYGLLAFTGVGFKGDKAFGFSSCPRQVGSAEGMNVLVEKKRGSQSDYRVTNIEYCDFKKFAIEDVPVERGSPYSQFPSNTNILFADIEAIKDAVVESPVPGMLVNLKKMSVYGTGEQKEVARLESVMQNIADCFVTSSAPSMPPDAVGLNTFLTYNQRRKTISATKKLYQGGPSLLETPEGCLYDLLQNAQELLSEHCGVSLPALQDPASYIKQGPSFLFFYHPALGPLYSLIGQKIRGGNFSEGSELNLEIAELEMVDLRLDGSLHVIATQVMGAVGPDGILRYSNNVGKCRLINVNVENRGIDRSAPNVYWKGEIARNGLCEIIIHGNGEFYAENITLPGNLKIEVKDGTRLVAYAEQGELKFKEERQI